MNKLLDTLYIQVRNFKHGAIFERVFREECTKAIAAHTEAAVREVNVLNRAWIRENTDLTACLADAEQWVADLQSGMYVNCVYCGHRYGPGETTPVSMADALKAHVEQCPKHPMSALRIERDTLKAAVEQAQELRDAVEYLFTPGPGISVPEPYPEQETYEPHKATWNKKVARLQAALTAPPGGHG